MRSRWSARAPWRWRMYHSPCTPGRNCKPWETSRWPFRTPGPPRQRCKRLRIQFRNRARQFRVVFPTPQKKAHPSGSYLRTTLSPRAPLRASQMFRGKHSLLATHRAIRDSHPAPRANVPIRVAPWRSRPTLPRPPRKLGVRPAELPHGQNPWPIVRSSAPPNPARSDRAVRHSPHDEQFCAAPAAALRVFRRRWNCGSKPAAE